MRTLPNGLFVVLAGLLAAGVAGAQTAAFTDVTPAIMFDNGNGQGVAWADYDNDGDLDLLISTEEGYMRLFRNDGGGSFTVVTPSVMTAGGNWTGIAWGDFDNDGDLDLLANEAERPRHLFRNDGGNNFVDLPLAVMSQSVHCHSGSWVDFDRDGKIDIFQMWAPSVQDSTRDPKDKLFRNLGGGMFADVTPPVLADPQYGTGNSWADYDNDGWPDLCAGNNGYGHIFHNNGGGQFTNVTPAAMNSYGHVGGIAWGDYDNDGDFDLFICRAYGVHNIMMRNDGAGGFTNVTNPVLALTGDCYGVAAADYDNDGDLDLLVGDATGPMHLLRNDGGFVFVEVTNAALAASMSTFGIGWADYDGDGDLDVAVSNGYGLSDKLFRNDLANGNHMLELDLVGVASNRSAIDARVEVWTGSVRQMQRVDGGSGYNSQNTLRLHFGLAAATVVDSIRIHWPSGIQQDTAMVAADQVLTIFERDSRQLGVPAEPVVDHARLLPLRPNPFQRSLTVEYELARPAVVELRVTDVGGRRVHVLAPASRVEAGRHQLSWDGRDDRGRSAPPGIYFVRMTGPGIDRTLRTVRLGE